MVLIGSGYFVVFCDSLWLLAVLVGFSGSWQFLAIFVGSCWFLLVKGTYW